MVFSNVKIIVIIQPPRHKDPKSR